MKTVSNNAIATCRDRVLLGASRARGAYTFAVPWVRTLAFAVGFFAQAVIVWQIVR
jgi:hypothetical protein